MIYLKSNPWTRPTDPVIVISGMIFGYPGLCCLAKSMKESARLDEKNISQFIPTIWWSSGETFCIFLPLSMNYFISKIPPRHMPLVALIKWQDSRLVEDESLHWDVTESTHIHLATGLIPKCWTNKKDETQRRWSWWRQWPQRVLPWSVTW